MEKKKATDVVLIIMGVLIVAAIGIRLSFIQQSTFTGIIAIAEFLLVALYVFYFYKIPHGNLLKYTILLFACAEMIKKSYHIMFNDAGYSSIVTIVVCGIVCYCAGRLNRIEQNKILFPIIEAYFIGFGCLGLSKGRVGFAFNFGLFNEAILFGIITIAYFLRYKEHKEAGLIDSPKN